MRIENQIRSYPECSECPVVQKEYSALQNNPSMVDKEIVLTQCFPNVSLIGPNHITMIGLITDEGRLDKLKQLAPDKGFYAPMIRIQITGNCEPLIQEKVKNITTKTLRFLHLE